MPKSKTYKSGVSTVGSRVNKENMAKIKTAELRKIAERTSSRGFLNSVAGSFLSMVESFKRDKGENESDEDEDESDEDEDEPDDDKKYQKVKRIQLVPELRAAAEETEDDLAKSDYNALSWIIAYQARPQSSHPGIFVRDPTTHAGLLIKLPNGKVFSAGITGLNKLKNNSSDSFLSSPDVALVNKKPHIHVAFPFNMYFYRSISAFIRNNVDFDYVKRYKRLRSHDNVYGRKHKDPSPTTFYEMRLTRPFSKPGTSPFPRFLYNPINCALGVQELLGDAINVGYMVAHPDMITYRYGPLAGEKIPLELSIFLYRIIFGDLIGEKDIMASYSVWINQIIQSMPPPRAAGGRRTRRARRQ